MNADPETNAQRHDTAMLAARTAPHLHTPRLVRGAHVLTQVHGVGTLSRFNAEVAVWITKIVGTMYCAYGGVLSLARVDFLPVAGLAHPVSLPTPTGGWIDLAVGLPMLGEERWRPPSIEENSGYRPIQWKGAKFAKSNSRLGRHFMVFQLVGLVSASRLQLDQNLAADLKLTSTNGAMVAFALSGGPADTAGIKPGDVIVSVDGKAVNTPDDLAAQIAADQPNRTIDVVLWRDGSRQEITVKLGAAQAP